MASTDLTIPISRLTRDVTMNVTVVYTRRWRVRQWLAVQLVKCAAICLGCNIVVNVERP